MTTTQARTQLLYALWLQRGARLGMLLLGLLFLAYTLGWGSPLLPPQKLASVWAMPLPQYLQASGMPTGWGWLQPVAQQGATDLASLAGMVVLAGCSLPALAAVLVQAWREGDRRLAWLCVAQMVVLLVAASGLLMSHGKAGA